MTNPFKELGRPRLERPQGVLLGGSFQCQECDVCVHEARYLDEISVLTWQCPEGHISKIEKFNIG